MFEEWLNFWRRWMFWWLPGGDTPADSTSRNAATRSSQPQQRPPRETAAGAGSQAQAPASTAAPRSAGSADDLTEIKGIGPALARKLDAQGVRTFADLAAADPERLAARLDSRPVTAERVRSWAAEARKRTG